MHKQPSGINIGRTKFTKQWVKHISDSEYDLKKLIIK